MFHRGLFVINAYSNNKNNDYKIHRLKEEFAPFGVTLDTKDALSLLPIACGDKTVFESELDYDFIIYLDKDRYLAKALSDKLPLFNSYESLVLSDDKMLSILELEKTGVKTPLTIPAPLCYVDSAQREKEETFFSFLEEKLSYPMVFKENHGSLGKQVKLIHDRKELSETYAEYRKVPHLYERFLKEHQGHDYRLIVIDGKVTAVMERVNENDFRSNIALGGKGYDATGKVPSSFEKMAVDAAHALHLDYAGVDLAMDSEGSPLFLEANGNAFFTEIEKVTGKNIAGTLVSMIRKRIY